MTEHIKQAMAESIDYVQGLRAERDRLRTELAQTEAEHAEFLEQLDIAFGLEDGEEARYSNPEGAAEGIYIDVAAAYKAERDRMRAALAEIRDRHRRHGDVCGDCERHRHRDQRTADGCDDPECRDDRVPHPCPDHRVAEAALTGGET